MQRTRSAFAVKMSALALAIAFQGAAFAAQPATGQAATPAVATESAVPVHPGHAGHHKHWRHHHQRAAMWVPGYGPVSQKEVSALKLDDTQAQLLKSAQSAQATLRQQRHDQMKQAWQARAKALESGKVDPHQAVAQREQVMQANHEARANVQKQWLALWDALKPEQQQDLAKVFKERAQKHAAWREKRAHHHEDKMHSQKHAEPAASAS
ncbi:MAG TPA: hypothetical protein VFR20_12160 [Burkholderiaceae bacterium]|nr:hypothetical protein [Burkholderiaceae bacterium]